MLSKPAKRSGTEAANPDRTIPAQPSLRVRYKALRKKILSLIPFIRRSRHERALARIDKYLQLERVAHEALGYLFFSAPALASSARFDVRLPLLDVSVDELCLFVTHAPKPQLKPHVIDHIEALLDSNVAVILIANTDLDANALEIPAALARRLSGCIVRHNVGYDFAAWSHAYSLIDPLRVRRRLFLINDSIIGPIDRVAYGDLLRRVRESGADLIGLTCNPDPHEHLQSFYLVFNERVLRSPIFDSFMRRVVNMPRKESVVTCYELWLTPYLIDCGFTAEALFPNISTYGPTTRNDTLSHWKELIAAGFPFIKSAVLMSSNDADEARKVLPERYLTPPPSRT
jgi:lipopolysaccharide biosynthesis protein